MLIIGEKINGTRKAVQAAVIDKDVEFIRALALAQVEAGADIIDLNAGTSPDREPDDLVWLVKTVQEVTDRQLCLDSPNPRALAVAMKAVNEVPMINSISGEPDRLSGVLPVAADNNCPLIALAMDEKGIPKGVDDRLAIIRRLFDEIHKSGLKDDRIYVDPLIMAVATNTQCGHIALDTMKAVRQEFPQAHLTGGMSNISFGLPLRSFINRAFITLAVYVGLDCAIIDPTDNDLLTTIMAAEVVTGQDNFCIEFANAFRANKIGPKKNET